VRDHVVNKIQHTLLQAFCVENHISMVHVVADAALMRLVGRLAGRLRKEEEDVDNACHHSLLDVSVLLFEVSQQRRYTEVWCECMYGDQGGMRRSVNGATVACVLAKALQCIV
jgi:hypothetical protein